MKKTIKKYVTLLLMVMSNLIVLSSNAQQSPYHQVYQYSVMVGSSRAYLWIPPDCKRVRAVIIALNNLTERMWLEDPLIRKTASEEGLGIIWVGPPKNKNEELLNANMSGNSGEALIKMLHDFANVSGYQEIARAPIIPTGHSAHGHFSWNVANWNQDRVVAVIAIKTIPLPDSFRFRNIPVLYMVGQTTEWPQYRDGSKPGDRDFYWPVVRAGAIALRSQNQNNLVGVLTDPGGGHFDWSDRLAKFLSLYIKKACEYRIPADEYVGKTPVKLKKILPQSGWLTGNEGMNKGKYTPAPYSQYKGNPDSAYWFFDKETTEAAARFEGDRDARKKQMLTIVQNGRLLNVTKYGFAPVRFQPDGDGVTFHLKGAFLKTVPAELIGSGDTLGNAGGNIKFYIITGPAVQTGPSTFKVQFDRSGYGSIWIEETVDGNKEYRHAVQPVKIDIPENLLQGKPQSINFPDIADQKKGIRTLVLNATASSGLPVQYCVVSGPAVVVGDTLHFTKIPKRSKYPVKVMISAYQWGSIYAPLYQRALPITKAFYITE